MSCKVIFFFISASLLSTSLATQGTVADDSVSRQSLEDAWWTGPIVAASAATLPEGHFLLEPYFYDVIQAGRFDSQGDRRSANHNQYLGSQTYFNYGLTDTVLIGVIPRFGYQRLAGGQSSTSLGLADLTLQGQVRLNKFDEQRRAPTLSFNVSETLPTGQYDRLQTFGNGLGAGSYATAFSLYSQTFFWMEDGRIVRARLDVTYTSSTEASIHDTSVYGTTTGFRGTAAPGDGYLANLAAEYSLTQNWVLASDLVWQMQANTKIVSVSGVRQNSGESQVLFVVPAVEYNLNDRLGVICGARIAAAGRNASASVTPVAAINYVF